MAQGRIELPLQAILTSPGFAMDIGGSMAKVVYMDKRDYPDGILEDKEKGVVRMGSFPRDDLDTVISFLQTNCYRRPASHGGERPDVVVTGMGGIQYRSELEAALNIRLVPRFELDCFISGLQLVLSTMTREELFTPEVEGGIREAEIMLDHHRHFARSIGTLGKGKIAFKEYEAPSVQPPLSYPFMLVMCGSAFKFIKVERDGHHEEVLHSPLGGRFFLGLTSYLTNITDFSKISEAINTSNGKSVDTLGTDLIPASGADPAAVFSLPSPPHPRPTGQSGPHPAGPPSLSGPPGPPGLPSGGKPNKNMRLFPFGKGITPDKERACEGDMIHSLVETLCENLATLVHQVCQNQGLHHALFCGGFINTPKVTHFLTREMHFKKFTPGETVEYAFIKNGGHLGALGGFIDNYSHQPEHHTHL